MHICNLRFQCIATFRDEEDSLLLEIFLFAINDSNYIYYRYKAGVTKIKLKSLYILPKYIFKNRKRNADRKRKKYLSN